MQLEYPYRGLREKLDTSLRLLYRDSESGIDYTDVLGAYGSFLDQNYSLWEAWARRLELVCIQFLDHQPIHVGDLPRLIEQLYYALKTFWPVVPPGINPKNWSEYRLALIELRESVLTGVEREFLYYYNVTSDDEVLVDSDSGSEYGDDMYTE